MHILCLFSSPSLTAPLINSCLIWKVSQKLNVIYSTTQCQYYHGWKAEHIQHKCIISSSIKTCFKKAKTWLQECVLAPVFYILYCATHACIFETVWFFIALSSFWELVPFLLIICKVESKSAIHLRTALCRLCCLCCDLYICHSKPLQLFGQCLCWNNTTISLSKTGPVPGVWLTFTNQHQQSCATISEQVLLSSVNSWQQKSELDTCVGKTATTLGQLCLQVL